VFTIPCTWGSAAQQLKEQVAAITQEKEQLASLLDQARVKAEESKAQFEQQLQAARRDAEKAARHKQKAGVTEELRKAKARVNKLSDALQCVVCIDRLGVRIRSSPCCVLVL